MKNQAGEAYVTTDLTLVMYKVTSPTLFRPDDLSGRIKRSLLSHLYTTFTACKLKLGLLSVVG